MDYFNDKRKFMAHLEEKKDMCVVHYEKHNVAIVVNKF